MVDIHCHILPGIDDGSRSLEESVEMIRMEVSGGTRAFIATPHVIDQIEFDRLENLPTILEELERALAEAQIEVAIHLGGEIYPDPKVIKALEQGYPLTLGRKGKHMLIDLPMGGLPNGFDDLIYEIQVRGITPIIAHPERCGYFGQDPERVIPYVEKGAALQVNSGSLSGQYGPQAMEVGRQLLRRRLAHFVASDLHRPRKRSTVEAVTERVGAELDADYLEILLERSGAAVIAGDPLPILPAAPTRSEKKRSWFGGLFGR